MTNQSNSTQDTEEPKPCRIVEYWRDTYATQPALNYRLAKAQQ